MDPLTIWRLAAAIGTLFGLGGVAYGVDQHSKREREQAANRANLEKIRAELAAKEEELARVHAISGKNTDRIRRLAAEILRLRRAEDEMRRSA